MNNGDRNFWYYFETLVMFFWQLPQNLVAIIMMPFIGKMKLICHENHCWAFECERMIGGISLGSFVFVSPFSAQRTATVLHEFGHVVDSHMFGPLYLFIIGIPSLCWAALTPKTKCYYDFYTEKRANRHAGLKVGRNKYGCYTYIPKDKEE